jgi:TolB-like protein/tetratricopeptide (TPR) repeat protein
VAPVVAPVALRGSGWRRWAWVAGIALLAAGALGAVWTRWPRPADPDPSIVVLPFINLSADEDNEYFTDGLTEEIIARLASVPGLKVISRTSAMHYKGTKRPLREIADAAQGRARSSRAASADRWSRVRISAQSDRCARPTTISGGESRARAEGQLPRAGRDRARSRQEARGRAGREGRTQLAKRGTRDPEAFLLYRRGRFLWSKRDREGHARALEYYQRAIARDSGYADAYAGIADLHLTAFQHKLMDLPEAVLSARQKQAAERAIELDDQSADAHAAFATALWWQRDWRGAERELRRAIELNPGHPDAHGWYALLLSGMGRSAEALAESRQDAERDPLTGESLATYGQHCYFSRDYDCAVDRLRTSVDVGNYPPALALLGLTYARKGCTPRRFALLRGQSRSLQSGRSFSAISPTYRR